MPDTLTSPSPSLASVRFREPYVSQGLNKKLNGVVAPGVIRGGKLETVGAGLSVKLVADPDFGDSIYSYVDVNGHQLTFRQVGDQNLDLSGVAGLPTDVYIALYINYSVSAATVIEWRAYTIAELTTAPVAEAEFVVVVGRVTVPAVGPIPAANISPDLRREAGMRVSSDIREWKQVVKNGDFQVAGTNSGAPLVGSWASGWSGLEGGTNYDVYIGSAAPLTGTHELELRADGVGAIADVAGESIGWHKCRATELLRARIVIRGSTWTAVGANGFVGLRVEWFDKDFSFLSSDDVGIDNTYSGTFAYTVFDKILQAPTSAMWVRVRLRIDTDAVVPGAGESIFIDQIKVWTKRDPLVEDSRDEDLDEMGGSILGSSLIMGPNPDSASTPDSQQIQTLLYKNIGTTPGVAGGEFLQLLGELLHADPATSPNVGFLKQVFGGHLQYLHTRDTETARETSCVDHFSFDAAGTKDLQVAFDFGTGTVRTDVGQLRIYTSNQIQSFAVASGFEVTLNARWDISAATWVRDVAGVRAWLLTITEFGIRVYREDTAAASWADAGWTNASGSPAIDLKMGGSGYGISVRGSAAIKAQIDVPSDPIDLAPGAGWSNASGISLMQQTVVKAWGHIEIDAAGNIITTDGYNFTAVRVGNTFAVTFVNALANADYAVVGSVSDEAGDATRAEMVNFANLATTGFTLTQHDDTGAAVNLAATAGIYMFVVFGES